MWFENFKVIFIENIKFFKIDDFFFFVFGLKVYVKKKGYKYFDVVFEKYGKVNNLEFNFF